ncbi:hypothetical protein VB10N_35690 [Vibrio sp. 10N]|nr:hypothetical protein VB10N_35690 [Vibrio sp. 10N]
MSGAFLVTMSLAYASSTLPDCDSPQSWAATMAYVQLTNSDINLKEKINPNSTVVTLLASEKIGEDIYRQIHHVDFKLHTGEVITVITSNEATSEECSYSGVDVYEVKSKYSSE